MEPAMNKLLLTAAVLALASAVQAQEETTMTMEEVSAEIMDAANAAKHHGRHLRVRRHGRRRLRVRRHDGGRHGL
jgi:isopropylmalate/homocitrate/citramalate synthase